MFPELNTTLQTHHPTPQFNPTPEMNPPPYSEDPLDFDDNSDTDTDSSPEDHVQQPLSLTINTASTIHGTNNLVQTPPPPYSEIASLSTSLLHAIHQINATSSSSCNNDSSPAAATAAEQSKPQRRMGLKVDLTINCGITVIGDRNVVGGIGLRPKGSTVAATGSSGAKVVGDNVSGAVAEDGSAASVVGAKRKAEDSFESENEDEPLAKKVAVETPV